MECNLNIAEVSFSFPHDFCAKPINAYFKPFWSDGDSADLTCDIISISPSELLTSLPLRPDECWSFLTEENRVVVQRRNALGEALWQYELWLDRMQVAITYNPENFLDHYFSIEDLFCRDMGISLLTLCLHARRGLFFHGSAAIINREAVLCVGPSGAGKTTIATLLACSGETILSDEHPIVRQWPSLSDGKDMYSEFRIYGSPWPSSGGYVHNHWAPLRRIYFLEHGPENKLHQVAPKEAIQRLIHVTTIPWHQPKLFDPCLKTIEMMLENIPAAVLSFRPDEDVVDVIRKDLVTEREII